MWRSVTLGNELAASKTTLVHRIIPNEGITGQWMAKESWLHQPRSSEDI